MSRKDECIDRFGDDTVFTSLDYISRYCKFEFGEPDMDKMTLKVQMVYIFIQMPFRLTKASKSL